MKNEEFGCAMQACRKVILHSSFLPSSCCYTFLQPKDEVYISYDIRNYINRYIKLYHSIYLFISLGINKYTARYNLIYVSI